MSRAFKSVEGFYAAAIAHPVKGPGGVLLGSVSLLFKPADLLSKAVDGSLQKSSLEPWAWETGGRILFDLNPTMIGSDVFKDPMVRNHPDLDKLARRIVSQPRGEGSAESMDYCLWTSLSLHGNSWRLGLAQQKTD